MQNLVFNGNDYVLPNITIGCESLGGTDWGDKDIDEISKTLIYASEKGYNCFDTADVYGLGLSEKRLNTIFGKKLRDNFIISKFGVRWKQLNKNQRAKTYIDLSLSYLHEALNNSLKRLELDAIPLYLIHWPNTDYLLDDILNALENYKQQGKILNYGICNFSLDHIKNADISNISAVCNSFSMINSTENLDILKYAERKKIQRLIYGTFGQGILAKKHDKNKSFGNNDRRSRLTHFKNQKNKSQTSLINKIEEISINMGVSMAQVTHKWTQNKKISDSTILGVSNIRQLKDIILADDFDLEPNDLKILDELTDYYRN